MNSLFNDDLRNSDYKILNYMISEIPRDVEGSGHGLIKCTVLAFAWRE
jgi:hypothetical protein